MKKLLGIIQMKFQDTRMQLNEFAQFWKYGFEKNALEVFVREKNNLQYFPF